MLIGAHVSVAAGYPQALEYARDVGAECAQIFAKSPRQWVARSLDPGIAQAFREARDRLHFGPVVTHTAYLINLGTTDELLRRKSIAALADELSRGTLLGADAVITHIGTSAGASLEEAAERIASAITQAFAVAGEVTSRLLLENTAGAGTTFGAHPREIGAVLRALPSGTQPQVGVCIDSCHAHAAGFDLSNASGWTGLLDLVDSECGADVIGALHANDCLSECGSHRDRHAWIGEGTIGEAGFAAMVCERRLVGVPAFTEMPGEVPVKDIENVSRLKLLRDGCSGRA